MRQIKLIWDFRGPNGKHTADHHLLHLEEFMKNNDKTMISKGTASLTEMHHIAYIVVEETDVKELRTSLKPHRGQVHAN